MTRCLVALTAACALAAQTHEAFSPTTYFRDHCATCHGSAAVPRAPSPAALRSFSPEAVYAAITTGSMKAMAANLTDAQRTALAETLTEQKLGVAALADAKAMSNPCPSNPPLAEPAMVVNGYGTDLANSRFVSSQAAGLSIDRIANLKLKWAFGFPAVSQMLGQPTVADGRLFVGSQAGYVYSLNASTGCVYWSFRTAAGVRTAPVFGAAGERAILWFGDLKANAYAIDAHTGVQIWKVNVDPHVAARITAAPVLDAGVLYVPVSSSEEAPASQPSYECCTFRGSVAALDARTGRKIWQTYTISEAPRPIRKNSAGTQLWSPAGGGVWGTPLVDPKRSALYLATGDAYISPAPDTTDAIMAMDLKTGAVLWSVQDLPNDAWNVACARKNDNCPEPAGPDYDFGAATILHNLANGKRVLLAGQKSGIVWAHDPDNHGAVLWKTDVTRKKPDPRGEIVWGGAADEKQVYYGLTSGGVVALDVATGEKKWLSSFNESGPHSGSSGAVTCIPGVVFSGGFDGMLRALATEDGKVLWQYDTKGEVQTVNGIKGSGGSLGAPGPVIANGMVYVESGYIGVVRGQPGNLLLAFGDSSNAN
ncbi:MAG: PQQ-binding-like beta-propeller repeat protein [Acidobacteriaceae bacterium]|nr:PQQ-binding-like beta-propeller repeat protein [Acidobacteriaceae bacterium]